jgi:predicted AlkP superfamily phosphohydrolase/phosphomutase
MSDKFSEPRLAIFGFDAGHPELLRQWVEEGRLPTLASIMHRGCWAKTKGPELELEHGVWHSIFSGLSRGQHGCYYFRQLKTGTYDLELVHGCDVPAPPFWAAWTGSRKRVLAVDIPDVPPVPGVAGLQLGNWAIHRGWFSRTAAEQPCSEPPALLAEVTRQFGPPLQIIETPGAKAERNRQILRDLLQRVGAKGRVCRYLLDRSEPLAVAICFGESHMAGHQFWRYRNAETNEFRWAIRDVYQAIDREIGLLLERLPASANVFIISSLGLADHYPTCDLLSAFCRELGYQVPIESPRVSLRPAALARRIVPERWRVALSRHLPREMRERLLARQFRNGIDWQKTTAFAPPSFYTGFVRVNLRGREPEGIIEPGAQYDALLQRIETDLHKLIDPQTGQSAIDRVVRAGVVYGRNPPDVLPDLIVHWKSCRHFVNRVMHPKTELTQPKPEFFRDTDHIAQGFVAATGPAIRGRGEVADVEVLDLAPTFLALLNEPKPHEMTGEPSEQLLAEVSSIE